MHEEEVPATDARPPLDREPARGGQPVDDPPCGLHRDRVPGAVARVVAQEAGEVAFGERDPLDHGMGDHRVRPEQAGREGLAGVHREPDETLGGGHGADPAQRRGAAAAGQ
ncbi:hypothetical protein GCM10020254_86690 [Streptomyces goshikiensis]